MTALAVLIREEPIAGIPAIHAAPQDRFDAPLPTIFLFHGFTSSKELSSYLGYMLAGAGFRVVLPEADLHGARFDGDEAHRLTRFWDILKRSIDELPALRDHCQAAGWIERDRVGVAGTSMGGFVALGSLVRYEWLRVGASYMGSGYYLDLSRTLYPPLGVYGPDNEAEHRERMRPLEPYDVSSRLDRLDGRPLFVWHGLRDPIVPCRDSVRLKTELEARGAVSRLEVIVDQNAEHKVPMAAADAGVSFFARRL